MLDVEKCIKFGAQIEHLKYNLGHRDLITKFCQLNQNSLE